MGFWALQAFVTSSGAHVPPTQTSPAGQAPLGSAPEHALGGKGPVHSPPTHSWPQEGQVPAGSVLEQVGVAVVHAPLTHASPVGQ